MIKLLNYNTADNIGPHSLFFFYPRRCGLRLYYIVVFYTVPYVLEALFPRTARALNDIKTEHVPLAEKVQTVRDCLFI